MQKQQATAEVIGTGVLTNGHSFYAVTSSSNPETVYVVEQWPTRLECLCKDRLYRRHECKHIRAVVAHKAKLEAARAHAEAVIAEDRVSHGMPAQSEQPAKSAAKIPAHGPWFAGRSQAPFSFMR